MKKHLKLGFAACLTAAFLFGGCKKDDNESDDQQKLILSAETIRKDKDGKIVGTTKTDNKYDSRGNCIESNTETTDGNGFSRQEKTLKKYDGQGNLIESETYELDLLTSKESYTYEGNVETRESTTYNRGAVLSTIKAVTTYTDSNREKIKSSITTTNFDNTISVTKQENTYGKDGNLTETSIFNENDELTQKTVYDSNNDITQYFYVDGNIDESRSFHLKFTSVSSEKLISQYDYFDGSKKETVRVTTLDNDGRQTGSETYENERLVMKIVYDGNVESITTYYYYDPNSTEPTYTIYTTYTYNK